MIRKFIKWFISPNNEEVTDDVYSKLLDLETRVERLEEENIGLTNEFYRMENSLDARIDILNENPWKEQFDV